MTAPRNGWAEVSPRLAVAPADDLRGVLFKLRGVVTNLTPDEAAQLYDVLGLALDQLGALDLAPEVRHVEQPARRHG